MSSNNQDMLAKIPVPVKEKVAELKSLYFAASKSTQYTIIGCSLFAVFLLLFSFNGGYHCIKENANSQKRCQAPQIVTIPYIKGQILINI